MQLEAQDKAQACQAEFELRKLELEAETDRALKLRKLELQLGMEKEIRLCQLGLEAIGSSTVIQPKTANPNISSPASTQLPQVPVMCVKTLCWCLHFESEVDTYVSVFKDVVVSLHWLKEV